MTQPGTLRRTCHGIGAQLRCRHYLLAHTSPDQRCLSTTYQAARTKLSAVHDTQSVLALVYRRPLPVQAQAAAPTPWGLTSAGSLPCCLAALKLLAWSHGHSAGVRGSSGARAQLGSQSTLAHGPSQPVLDGLLLAQAGGQVCVGGQARALGQEHHDRPARLQLLEEGVGVNLRHHDLRARTLSAVTLQARGCWPMPLCAYCLTLCRAGCTHTPAAGGHAAPALFACFAGQEAGRACPWPSASSCWAKRSASSASSKASTPSLSW